MELPTLEFVVGGNHARSNIGVGRVTEKFRRRSVEDLGKEDPTVNMHGRKI